MSEETTTATRARRAGSMSEALTAVRRRAAGYPGCYVDLSTASPVDPVPGLVAEVVAAAADAPGYPATEGTPAVRAAIAAWFDRVRGVPGLTPAHVLPTIGSKEFIGLLPFLLGLGPGDVVVRPALAYPAYAAGADAVGAETVAEDDPARWPPGTRLIWLNSPGNPDGGTLDLAGLRAAVARARELGAVIVADECYAVLDEVDGRRIPSILDPAVVGDDLRDVLVSYSMSKQSNLAGHRVGLAAGDPALIAWILGARRRLGLIVPRPTQDLLAALLGDDRHVAEQRERYRRRLVALRAALAEAGFRIDSPEAGIYVWATRGEDCWDTVRDLADAGVLAFPGTVFGDRGAQHVRFAVTVSDEGLATAVERLAALG